MKGGVRLRRWLYLFAVSTARASIRVAATLAIAVLLVLIIGQTSEAARAADVAQVALTTPPDRSADLAALKRGALMFSTYCASCHSAHLVPFSTLRQLGFTDKEIDSDLDTTGAPLTAGMTAAMPPGAAKKAFGATPPDLSLISREKGQAWLYTYLRSFYMDPDRPLGSNNVLVPGVNMPDVLAGLHGPRTAVFAHPAAANGQPNDQASRFTAFSQQAPGSMSPAQYDSAMADLVAYMAWLAEPSRIDRHRLAPWVVGFLLLFSFSAWRLSRSYRVAVPNSQDFER